MGGDCSQKAHAPERTALPSGALQASGSARNQDSIASTAAQPCQVVVYSFSRWVQYGNRPAKRRRAMLESNPSRNSRSQTHQDDEIRGEAGNDFAPAFQSKLNTSD
jgi:hypothetical protein